VVDSINDDSSEAGLEFPFACFAQTNVLPANDDARIDSKEVARLSGLKRRTVVAHAGRGLIPSAEQFGTKWTFDAVTIRAWAKDPKGWMKTIATTSTSVAKPTGFAPPSADENSVKAFTQLLSLALRTTPRSRVHLPCG
jgi:hypothetical protein